MRIQATPNASRAASVAESALGTVEDGFSETGEDDLDTDALNEIVMAIDIRGKGIVGCSYYVAREEKLYFMEDVKCGGVDVVDTRRPDSHTVQVAWLKCCSQALH